MLARAGYYEGAVFHRVIKGFMIQGGAGSGRARPIRGEFSANGVPNALKHTRGVISMARTQVPDSASSQFFVMHAAAPHLDGAYAAFGTMLSGFETLDAIATVATRPGDRPVSDIVIDSVTVETFGEEPEQPVFVR
jgi:peptidyl-prolyl cis-trans isomerase B (cyclophilin B)